MVSRQWWKGRFQSPSRRFFFCNSGLGVGGFGPKLARFNLLRGDFSFATREASRLGSRGEVKFQSPSRRFFFCNGAGITTSRPPYTAGVSISFAEIFLLQQVLIFSAAQTAAEWFQSPSRRFFFCNPGGGGCRPTGAPVFQSPSRRFFFCNRGNNHRSTY